ncbi:MAG: alpha/beta fold hydrolase [Bauldia sp.]|nr:alpha/beta fold hydrolase [Bauldia sp.]
MKPPILLLHGACSQPAHLRAWEAYFASAGYPCVAPALPGHAPDDRAALARLGIKDYLAAVVAARSALDRPPVVIGHSLGGLLAQQLAAKMDCAAIVLVASLPPGPLPMTLMALPHFSPLAPAVLLGRPILPTRLGLEVLALHDLAVAEREEILPDFGHESGRVYRSLVFGRVRVEARAVRCPVLVLHGEADRLVPVAVGRRLARRYGAELIVVPGHGHWLIAGSLLEIAAAPVLDWIEGLG